jgi:hypothetical protein
MHAIAMWAFGWKILYEGTPKLNIQQLKASADGKNWKIKFERGHQHICLKLILLSEVGC